MIPRALGNQLETDPTVASDSFAGLECWRRISGDRESPACFLYGGDKCLVRRGIAVHSWNAL